MGLRAGLDGQKISSPPGFDPRNRPARSSVAIPTELPGLQKFKVLTVKAYGTYSNQYGYEI